METQRLWLTSIFLISFIMCINANKQKTIPSKLDEATIFYRGAELKHSASATLSKGTNEITIEGLSPEINISSIKIKTSSGVVVSSYEYMEDHISKNNMDLVRKSVEDSIDIFRKKIKLIEIETKANKEMLDLFGKSITQKILNSEKDSSKNKISLDELIKSVDYLKNKSIEVETFIMKSNDEKTCYEETINRLSSKLELEESEMQAIGRLKLNVTAQEAKTAQFVVSYCTYAAGWTPFYNINVVAIDRPIQLISKANVFQRTGVDWEEVKLTLSTGTPANGKIAPLFSTWFLQDIQHIAQRNTLLTQNAYIYSNSRAKEKVAAEEEIQENSMNDYLTVNDNQLMMTYAIDLPYTIPGDGKEQHIDLRVQETKAAYHFYCAPRLDNESYLLAELTESEKLDLPYGKAQITYDGMHVGETIIDGSSTMENLTLTLGTDRRVSVKREKLHDFSSKKFLGSDIKQVFTYKITVKNNQQKTIKMVLKDQYPTSTQKGIEVELLKETTKPTFNKAETGVVTWEDTFAPGETKTYQISYSVKYPKDMSLNL